MVFGPAGHGDDSPPPPLLNDAADTSLLVFYWRRRPAHTHDRVRVRHRRTRSRTFVFDVFPNLSTASLHGFRRLLGPSTSITVFFVKLLNFKRINFYSGIPLRFKKLGRGLQEFYCVLPSFLRFKGESLGVLGGSVSIKGCFFVKLLYFIGINFYRGFR